MWASMNKANYFIFKLYYECLFFSLPVTAVTFSAAALFPLLHDSRLTTNSDIKLMSFKSLWINITLILEMMVPLFLSGTSTLIFLFFPHMYVTHTRTVMWHVKNFIKIPFHMWAGDDIMNVQRWWQSCYGYTSSLLCKDNMDGRGLGTAACSSVYKLSGLIGSRCCCTVWTVQSALAPRGLVAETRSGYRSRVVMMSCNATGGLWRGCCSNDEPYQWIMGVLGVKGPQTLHTVASVVHTSLLQGVYESAEGGVCGSMCPYMGSVRLGELCSAGNAGRFLECLVAFVCARHESKTQTRSWMKS